MRWTLLGRSCVLGAAALTITVALAGCGGSALESAAPDQSSSSADPDGIAADPLNGAPGTLPNGVPLVAGAHLVSGPTDTKKSATGSGWTAVALTPAATEGINVFNALSQALSSAGWIVQPSTKKAATTIAAQRASTDSSRPYSGEWLQISVTTAIVGAGPAITYRYATITAPQRIIASAPVPSLGQTR